MKDIAEYRMVTKKGTRTHYVVTTGTVYGNENDRYYPSDAYVDDSQPGVIRWASNDRCVPIDICERMDWPNTAAQRIANEADTSAFFAEYRRQQAEFDARTDPEAEEIRREQAYERRAALGPGAEVVDVITGRRYRT